MVILLLAFLASVSKGLVGLRDRFADPVFAKNWVSEPVPLTQFRCKDSDFFANGNVFR